ncbi:MAG: hypothetical protein GEV11_26320 [Streptosporangiales bacterium]|nr:hypothetical protein [Streptosporangiales bacterium]
MSTRVRWRAEVAGPGPLQAWPDPWHDAVYVANGPQVAPGASRLYRFDLRTGELTGEFRPRAAVTAVAATPVADDGSGGLYVCAGHRLLWLDPATLAVRATWSAGLPSAATVLAAEAGRPMLATRDGTTLTFLDPADGSVRRRRLGRGLAVAGPAPGGGVLVVARAEGRVWRVAADGGLREPWRVSDDAGGREEMSHVPACGPVALDPLRDQLLLGPTRPWLGPRPPTGSRGAAHMLRRQDLHNPGLHIDDELDVAFRAVKADAAGSHAWLSSAAPEGPGEDACVVLSLPELRVEAVLEVPGTLVAGFDPDAGIAVMWGQRPDSDRLDVSCSEMPNLVHRAGDVETR